MRFVCLVDGVGRSRLVEVETDMLPETIRVPHGGAPNVIVNFDQTMDADSEGRAIYRQRGAGEPAIRAGYAARS